jgi:hypothetical protein
MNIEDLTISLVLSSISMNPWDQKLINSLYDQISRGSGFTEKQSTLVLKTLVRYSASLSAFLQKDISPFLSKPSYRLPIRQINTKKKLSIVEHEQYKKVISAIFPYSEEQVALIRKNKDQLGYAVWDKEEKCWFFSLTEYNVQFLMELAEKENFEIDEEFQNYANQIKDILKNIEPHIPMLVIEEKTPKIVNCSKNMPPLETTDLLRSVFEARQRGILTWDETISKFLDSDEVDPITREFLKSEFRDSMHIDSEIHKISVLGTIVKNMGPILVVIPGGSELENLMIAYKFLSEIGISNNEISVMFRLPSDTHENFNNFVKNNNLNSPLTEQTKIVFVSSKLPKPVLKSKIKFHSILNMGFNNVHYTMRDFVGNHENLIFYSKKKDHRNQKLAFM